MDVLMINELLTVALPAVLQGDAAPAAPINEAMQVQSVWDFVRKGGIMMIPLGLCSLVALAVVAERLIVLRKSQIIPSGFLKKLAGVIEKVHGGIVRVKTCRRRGSPAPILGIPRMENKPEKGSAFNAHCVRRAIPRTF